MEYVKPSNYAMDLFQYKKNVYSQNGEDGIIAHLIEKLGIENGWCCEFGAWDGKHLSNTFNLIENRAWNSVLIECDELKFEDLLLVQKEFPSQIIAKKEMVHYLPDSGRSLDDILKTTDIPHDFDLLSIDVDGPDYHIWKSFSNYEPKIVIVEHSGLKEPIVQREGAIHKKEKDGSTSFFPMKELGESKGYKLLVDTGNLIFIHNEYQSLLGL